ncbi:hypothetical protein R83H12_01134 [Fibrobacteria bacterium R8-3-H12]
MTKSVRFWRKKCIFIGRGKKNDISSNRSIPKPIRCLFSLEARRYIGEKGYKEIGSRFVLKIIIFYGVGSKSTKFLQACLRAHEIIMGVLTPQATLQRHSQERD